MKTQRGSAGDSPRSRAATRRVRERGFSLPGAIFLISVLAAVAAVVINVSTAQQATTLLSLQAARAQQAAASGIAYAARRALVDGSCADATFTPTASGLNGFTVSVTCRATTVTEGSTSYAVYTLGATGTAGSSATGDLVSRSLLATVTSAP